MFRSGTFSAFKTARHSLVIAALSSTMLGAYVMVPAHAADHGGWATTKVAGENNSGYCAVSRKVEETMITIGRSMMGQSSLALEFSKGKLDPKKVYHLSLKPGNAERLEVESKPVSPTTLVLNLDQVVDLAKSFDASPTLQLRYDTQSIALSLANWDIASKDLANCLTDLKGKGDEPKTADKNDKPAQKSKTVTKADNTRVDPVKTKTSTAEDLMSAPADEPVAIKSSSNDELQALRDQNEKLNDVLRATRQELENAEQNAKGAPVDELQEKIKLLEAQNNDLKDAVKKASMTPDKDSGAVVAKLRAERDQANDELAKLKSQLAAQSTAKQDNSKIDQAKTQGLLDQIAVLQKAKSDLEVQLNVARTAQQAKDLSAKSTSNLQAQLDQLAKENVALKAQVGQKTVDVAKTGTMSDEISKLKADNQVLQAKLDAAMTTVATAPKVDPAAQKKIDELQAKIDHLDNDNADLHSKLAAATAANIKAEGTPDVQQRLEAMAAENVKLRASLAAATTPNPTDVKVEVAAEQPLRQQLRTLQAENDALRARADELSKMMDDKQKDGEKDLLKASSKNWNLEQATRRYEEASREIKRLSLTMQDERSKCSAEKKQIEYMLFDPKVAKEGQIALLNSLEDEVASLRAGKCGVPNATASVAPANAAKNDVAVVPTAPVSAPVVPAVPQPAAVTIAKDAPPVMQGTVPPSKQVTAEALAAPASVAQVNTIAGVDGLTNLLQQAGVTISQAIAPAKRNPFGAGVAYVWESNELAGLAVQQPNVKPSSFDLTVSKDLGQLKSSCKGDFAAQPSTQTSTATLSYAAYDAACIAGANSTSAAILFFQKDGAFNIISHEVAPDDMAKAMEARDRIVTTLGGRPL